MLTVEDEEKILLNIIKQLEDQIKMCQIKIQMYNGIIETLEKENPDD